MVRVSTKKFFILCCTIIILSTSFMVFKCSPCPNTAVGSSRVYKSLREQQQLSENDEQQRWRAKTLAVIVPYRDRFEELQEFVPRIHAFLNQQRVPHHIAVVNQADSLRFNRAALINIGFLNSRNKSDYFVMHDVDLIPKNPDLLYTFPEQGPFHLASPEYHPKYHYKTYIGGVLMMTNEQFEKCNGMSNIFWGWGREDDELYLRFKDNGLQLYRPTNLTSGYNTFDHVHDKQKRPRDYNRYGDQKKAQFQRDRSTGLDNLKYTLLSAVDMTIKEAPVTLYNVELFCDRDLTPWCIHSPSKT